MELRAEGHCWRPKAAAGSCNSHGWLMHGVTLHPAQGLRLDWRLGAALFECLLVDCDWALNWGNWAYVSGECCFVHVQCVWMSCWSSVRSVCIMAWVCIVVRCGIVPQRQGLWVSHFQYLCLQPPGA